MSLPALNRPSAAAPGSTWKKHLRGAVPPTLDLTVLVVAFLLAYQLRFDFHMAEPYVSAMFTQLPFVVVLQFVALRLTGVHHFVWRYIGLREIPTFFRSALYSALTMLVFSAVPVVLLRLGLPDNFGTLWRVPLSVIFMDTLLAFAGLLALRVGRRLFYEREKTKKKGVPNGGRKRVLLVGAGQSGVIAAREIQGRGSDLLICGFVDDDAEKRGTVIQGVRVLGTTHDLPVLVQELGIDHVIITIVEAPRSEIRRIVSICEAIPIKVRIVPGLYEILEERVAISRVRDVEIEDILGRTPIHLNEDELRHFLTGKRVMVTGAGGSIGSELTRQAAHYDPAKLILVERAETALFHIERYLRQRWEDPTSIPVVADVGDRARMQWVFHTHRPQVILHAAAHKHVPLMETNCAEAIKNNVLATRLVGELAGEFETETFVLISTDKALRPISIMGASKRAAELVVQDLDRCLPTRFVAVRFGNVAGSNGSVIPLFREQIERGGPVTVTHEGMERYFMTIPEAAQLVLQAGSICRGGEILILDMGEPLKILDLAKDMIKFSGLKLGEDITIEITGVRPGERLFEHFDMKSQTAPTQHPKIYVGKLPGSQPLAVKRALEDLKEFSDRGQDDEIRAVLSRLIPEASLGWERPSVEALANMSSA